MNWEFVGLCPDTINRRDVAQLGRALRSGRRGHRFKSCHPDHFSSTSVRRLFSRFSPAARRVLRAAEQECRNHEHYYVGVEHMLFALLDEQQRRLYAGLESLQLGGDRQIAELLGLDPHTVAKGRRQLLAQDVETDRVRARGGGRKPVEKKHPR